MAKMGSYQLKVVGFVESPIKKRKDSPMQGYEGAPEAWVRIVPAFARAAEGLAAGDEIILLSWLHQARRETLKVHPRSDKNLPLTGVFATRSPDRPNPIGLHRVTVLDVDKDRLKVGPLEVIDGTPIVDIKPVLRKSSDS